MLGTLQHYFFWPREKQAGIQEELHGHPVRGEVVVSCW